MSTDTEADRAAEAPPAYYKPGLYAATSPTWKRVEAAMNARPVERTTEIYTRDTPEWLRLWDGESQICPVTDQAHNWRETRLGEYECSGCFVYDNGC